MAPSREPFDLLYIESTVLNTYQWEHKSLSEWLALLVVSKAVIDVPRLIRALDMIDGALDGKIAQDAVAGAAGTSKSSFTKLFRATGGMPLRRFVLWRCLNVAVAAMGEGAAATTAAHTAGFSDSAHFFRGQ